MRRKVIASMTAISILALFSACSVQPESETDSNDASSTDAFVEAREVSIMAETAASEQVPDNSAEEDSADDDVSADEETEEEDNFIGFGSFSFSDIEIEPLSEEQIAELDSKSTDTTCCAFATVGDETLAIQDESKNWYTFNNRDVSKDFLDEYEKYENEHELSDGKYLHIAFEYVEYEGKNVIINVTDCRLVDDAETNVAITESNPSY